MIKTVEELRARLEGKTERTAIESILNGATIAAMKGYIAAERYDICTGRNLVKADYVNALTSVVYSLVPEENPASVADENVMSFFRTILASNIDAEKYVRVLASLSLYEKITSTSEPHKFSNLPEAEIRVMLGFEARYTRLGSERGMYGLFTNDLNTVNVEDTAKAAKYFVELVHSVFQSDYERATGQTGAEGTKEEEAMTVAETIKTAGTVDAIAETLMKCGKVNDMAIAFRTVTGRDFTGKIVGVNKDNLSYDMAREIKMQFERESFAALTVSEKITFLCERDAYDTGRFLRVCRVEELREIARSIGADTAGVRTDYEMAEKLDYMSAISEKLLFRIGYAQHQPAEEKGTTQVAEIIPASDNDNALASQPAIVATAESDLPAKILNADNKSAFDTRLALLEKLPLSVLTDFAHNELIDTAGISAEKMSAYVRLILNERLSNIARGLEVTDNGIAIQTPLLSLYRESRGFLPANIRFRVATQYCGTDKNGVKHVVFIDKRQPDTISAGLVYDGNSHKVYGTAFDFAVRVRNGVEEITYFKFGCPGATEDLEFTVSANAVEPDYDDPDYPGYKPAIQSEIRYEPLYKRDFGISSRITASAGIAQSEVLYMDDSYSDAPGDNSHPEEDIPEAHIPEETHAPVKANQHREKFLQCRSISAKTKEITAMLNRYAEINGTVRAIHDGIKIFRKGIKIREKQGLPTDAFEKAIKEVREKYREWRIEGFKLRLKLLRVMSASEIRRACEMYIARCERIRRRHMRK